MDISKLINDYRPANMLLKEYKEEMYGSWVSERKRIHEVSEIPFSYDTDKYLEIIQKYVKDDRSFHRAIHGINKFKESCLLMGELLYKARSNGIPVMSPRCESAFTLVTNLYLEQDIKGRESPKFLNINVRLHTLSDNVVYIRISESENHNDFNDREFMCYSSYCIEHRIPGMYIRSTQGYDTYKIMNKEFNPPPYDKLPLYINVPFLDEYARYMFENPPSPPPAYRMPFNLL